MNLNDVAIVSVNGSNYIIHFWYMSKNDAINIMRNSNLNEKSWSLYIFLIIHKNEWNNFLSKKHVMRCYNK